MSAGGWLLPQAATIARPIDTLFFTMVGLCALVALAVMGAIVFYGIRYRRGSGADRSGAHSQSLPVELTWILVPFAIFVAVFLWSLALFARARTPPPDAQTVYVIASSGCGRSSTRAASVRSMPCTCRSVRRCASP